MRERVRYGAPVRAPLRRASAVPVLRPRAARRPRRARIDARREERRHGEPGRGRGDAARRSRSPRAASAPPAPTRSSAASSSTPAGEVVGEGFHAYAGGPHAEVRALAAAGERARGGTAVVTLEPCNHTGRTGPCSEALIRAGVVRVVAGVADPNPVAAGGADDAARARGRGRARATRGRGARRQPGLADRDPAGRRRRPAPVRDLEVRRPRWTAGRPRSTAPASGSPRRTPAPTCRSCAAPWTRSSSASAPCSPTTRT